MDTTISTVSNPGYANVSTPSDTSIDPDVDIDSTRNRRDTVNDKYAFLRAPPHPALSLFNTIPKPTDFSGLSIVFCSQADPSLPPLELVRPPSSPPPLSSSASGTAHATSSDNDNNFIYNPSFISGYIFLYKTFQAVHHHLLTISESHKRLKFFEIIFHQANETVGEKEKQLQRMKEDLERVREEKSLADARVKYLEIQVEKWKECVRLWEADELMQIEGAIATQGLREANAKRRKEEEAEKKKQKEEDETIKEIRESIKSLYALMERATSPTEKMILQDNGGARKSLEAPYSCHGHTPSYFNDGGIPSPSLQLSTPESISPVTPGQDPSPSESESVPKTS